MSKYKDSTALVSGYKELKKKYEFGFIPIKALAIHLNMSYGKIERRLCDIYNNPHEFNIRGFERRLYSSNIMGKVFYLPTGEGAHSIRLTFN